MTENHPFKMYYNLVIGLSGPYGSGCSSLAEELEKIINDWPGCRCCRIQVSDLIKYYYKLLIKPDAIEPKTGPERREYLQNAGNFLRKKRSDIIGIAVASEAFDKGEEIEQPKNIDEVGTIVFIVDSLKNTNDLKSLRHIFKDEFYFCFVTANDEIRWKRMRDYKYWKEDEKNKFLEIDDRDSDEAAHYPDIKDEGQQVKELAAYADYYFINNVTREELHESAYRMVCLIFGLGINQPTIDEKSMHLAFSSANQSACLSRQVGAAIFTKEGNILSIGHNDVPKAKGGLYSVEDGDHDNRCMNIGDRRCMNFIHKEKRFRRLSADLSNSLAKFFSDQLSDSEAKSQIVEALTQLNDEIKEDGNTALTPSIKGLAYKIVSNVVEKSDFKDATEYCRAVHAEMDALLSVCRNLSGSTLGATMYVTTQPCHNCAKHLIAAGVERVVYIEPYPKSLGDALHSDAISLNPQDNCVSGKRISFILYQGAAPRRYHDLFDMGDEKRKDKQGRMEYIPKEQRAQQPKFSIKVTKRSRLDTNNPAMNLISFNESQASATILNLHEEGKNGPEMSQTEPTGTNT
ncbi:hypothetical protein HGB07_05790 [Candidatus Roizmanbacteria bacterium]|nr:hypothetical protein [Candidatus Roizmanbacteria bacterium]